MENNEPKKRGRKPKKKPYFGPAEEEAVREYLSLGTIIEDDTTEYGFRWTGTTADEKLRNKIYRDVLRAPLNKMVESIIRRYKLYSKKMEYEDLHADTLSFLHVKFHKFKPDKNKKSYSYFGTICKHYLLGKLMKEDKNLKVQTQYEDISSSIESDIKHSYNNVEEPNLELTKFISKISEAIKEEMSEKVLTENELKVGTALTKILDEWEVLFDDDNVPGKNKFNKNLILYYMREMTTLNTKDIRNAMKRYKVIYKILKEDEI
jgi:hypothetical protein